MMHGPLNVKIFLILYLFFNQDREVYCNILQNSA